MSFMMRIVFILLISSLYVSAQMKYAPTALFTNTTQLTGFIPVMGLETYATPTVYYFDVPINTIQWGITVDKQGATGVCSASPYSLYRSYSNDICTNQLPATGDFCAGNTNPVSIGGTSSLPLVFDDTPYPGQRVYFGIGKSNSSQADQNCLFYLVGFTFSACLDASSVSIQDGSFTLVCAPFSNINGTGNITRITNGAPTPVLVTVPLNTGSLVITVIANNTADIDLSVFGASALIPNAFKTDFTAAVVQLPDGTWKYTIVVPNPSTITFWVAIIPANSGTLISFRVSVVANICNETLAGFGCVIPMRALALANTNFSNVATAASVTIYNLDIPTRPSITEQSITITTIGGSILSQLSRNQFPNNISSIQTIIPDGGKYTWRFSAGDLFIGGRFYISIENMNANSVTYMITSVVNGTVMTSTSTSSSTSSSTTPSTTTSTASRPTSSAQSTSTSTSATTTSTGVTTRTSAKTTTDTSSEASFARAGVMIFCFVFIVSLF